MNSTFEQICVLTANASDLYTLLNVVDEQHYLQQSMSSEAVQECIHGGDTNIARVQILCEKILEELTEGGTRIYDSLCDYFLKRAEAYQSMHQRFMAHSQVYLAQQKTELESRRSREAQSGKHSDMMPTMDIKQIEYLIQKVSEIKDRLDERVPHLQSSLNMVSKDFARLPPFPNPYSQEMREKMDQTSSFSKKRFNSKCVPILCNENGEYFVDWSNKREQWRFGKYGSYSWTEFMTVRCSLLLPRQFNGNGVNDRVVNMEVIMNGNSLIINMIHDGDYAIDRQRPIPLKGHIHLLIKPCHRTPFVEFRDRIQYQVGFHLWTNVFQSGELPTSSFSYEEAPSLRLTLSPCNLSNSYLD